MCKRTLTAMNSESQRSLEVRAKTVREAASLALADTYELVATLGEGATAFVFAARELARGREVAIKVMRPELATAAAVRRFQQELVQLGRLMHPGILPVLNAGESGGIVWYAMPRAVGNSLRSRIDAAGQLPIDEALRITIDLADALDHAHSHGVVHRDVKPENVLLAGDRALLVDFSHALAPASEADRPADRTRDAIVVGTAEYASPEQAAGGAVDGRSDLYSLGCVLYEMLAGHPPFRASTLRAVLGKHMSATPPDMKLDRAALSPDVHRLMRQLLAKTPADRPATAADVRRELERVRTSPPVITPIPGRARVLLPVATLVVVATMAWAWKTTRDNTRIANTWPVTSLAVMPIVDLTPGRGFGWLVEGLTNELIDALASVRELDVRTFQASNAAQAESTARDSLAERLRVGSLVDGTLEEENGRLTLKVRVSDARSQRAAGDAIHLLASRDRADSLRFGLVDRVSVELRKRVGARLETMKTPDRGLDRKAWELYRRAEALNREIALANADGAGVSMLPTFAQADSLYARAAALAPHWEAPTVSRGWLYEHHARFVADTSRNLCTQQCLDWRAAALNLLGASVSPSVAVRELRGAIRIELARAATLPDSAARLRSAGEADLLSAVREDSSRVRAWVSLSTSRARQGDPEGAVAALRSAERADPWMTMEPEVLERWGTSARSVGDFDEAARLCELGRARYAQRASFQQCRLVLLGERGRGRADIASVWDELGRTTAAIPDSSADVTWWFRRCMVAAVIARTGLRDSAYAVLAASRRQRPTNDPNLLVQESFVSAQARDTARVVELLDQFLKQVPTATEVLARERRFKDLHGSPAFEAMLRRHRAGG